MKVTEDERFNNLRWYLQKVNDGSLYGQWLDLNDYYDFDELMDAMRELHENEESPEFMFQDYECWEIIEYLGLISESHIPNEVYDVIDTIENSSYYIEVIEVYTYCTSNLRIDIESVLDEISNNYMGKHSSDSEFVQEILEFNGEVPKNLPQYIVIGWERKADNLMFDYCSHSSHYFRSV